MSCNAFICKSTWLCELDKRRSYPLPILHLACKLLSKQGLGSHAGMTDMATMWAHHLPAGAHSMGTLGAFPTAPSGTFNPQLYGLQASQQ